MFMMLIGIFLFMYRGGSLFIHPLGILFTFVYTFFFALTNIYIKQQLSAYKESNSILFTNNCITLLFVIIYNGLTTTDFAISFSISSIGLIVLSSLCTGLFGTLLVYEALKRLKFSTVTVTRSFSPLISAVIAYPFYPVALSLPSLLGAALIIASILLLSIKKQTSRLFTFIYCGL